MTHRTPPTPPADLDDQDDLLDFTFANVPTRPRKPQVEMDRDQADRANAIWLIDQGIQDADPLSTRNRK